MAATVATRQKKARKSSGTPREAAARTSKRPVAARPAHGRGDIVAGENDSDLGSQSDADPPPPTTAQRRADRDERVVERAVQRDISRINRTPRSAMAPIRSAMAPFRSARAEPSPEHF